MQLWSPTLSLVEPDKAKGCTCLVLWVSGLHFSHSDSLTSNTASQPHPHPDPNPTQRLHTLPDYQITRFSKVRTGNLILVTEK